MDVSGDEMLKTHYCFFHSSHTHQKTAEDGKFTLSVVTIRRNESPKFIVIIFTLVYKLSVWWVTVTSFSVWSFNQRLWCELSQRPDIMS